MKFDKNYFDRQRFTQIELNKYYNSIKKNLTIARSNPEPEIRFHFTPPHARMSRSLIGDEWH